MLVPETAVDEHHSAISGQDNVGFARKIPPVKPKAKSFCVQSLADQ
jgi:hypothetical protein